MCIGITHAIVRVCNCEKTCYKYIQGRHNTVQYNTAFNTPLLWLRQNFLNSLNHNKYSIDQVIPVLYAIWCYSGACNNAPTVSKMTWWRHQMETFSALLAICVGSSPVPGDFPAQRLVTRSFDVFFDLCPHKRLNEQSRGWWIETLSRPLWRHCNEIECNRWKSFPTWINFNPMWLHPLSNVWRNYLNTLFHLIHFCACDYLSMLVLRLIHVCKR